MRLGRRRCGLRRRLNGIRTPAWGPRWMVAFEVHDSGHEASIYCTGAADVRLVSPRCNSSSVVWFIVYPSTWQTHCQYHCSRPHCLCNAIRQLRVKRWKISCPIYRIGRCSLIYHPSLCLLDPSSLFLSAKFRAHRLRHMHKLCGCALCLVHGAVALPSCICTDGRTTLLDD